MILGWLGSEGSLKNSLSMALLLAVTKVAPSHYNVVKK